VIWRVGSQYVPNTPGEKEKGKQNRISDIGGQGRHLATVCVYTHSVHTHHTHTHTHLYIYYIIDTHTHTHTHTHTYTHTHTL
jgi:hypothetical protein